MSHRLRRSSSTDFHKIHDYFVGDEIGSGAFSSIRQAVHNKTFVNYAFKIISKRKLSKFPEILVAESVIAPILRHPHIINIVEKIEAQGQIFQVIELYKEGDLASYLSHKHPNNGTLLRFTDEIMSAVEFLHKYNICHRDIKLENVLLTDDFHCRLCDFGFATIATNEITSGKVGSYGYTAPEVMTQKTYNGKKADIWSLGILIYMMFSSSIPDFEKTVIDPSILDFKGFPPGVANLVCRMVQIDPQDRPDIEQLRADECFKYIERAADSNSPDFNIPIEYPIEIICSQLSEIFHRSVSDVKEYLAQEKINECKIIYYLYDNLLKVDGYEQNTPGHQMNHSLPSNSSILDFVNMNSMDNVRTEYYNDNRVKVYDSIYDFVLKQHLCISGDLDGTKTLILNTMNQDLRIKVNLSELNGGKSCELVMSSSNNGISLIDEICTHLETEFPSGIKSIIE